LPPLGGPAACSCQCWRHERTHDLAADARRIWPSGKQSGLSTGLQVASQPESVFSVDAARVPFCAGTAYVWLDPQRAVVHSQEAIDLYDAATGTGRWPANRALVRLDLAMALAQLGEPEEASHAGLEALAIFAERPVDSVMRRARDLEAVLDVEPYRRLPAGRQFREQLQTTRAEAGLA
jgi:hypothetical protein